MQKVDRYSFLQNLASRKLLALNIIAALTYVTVLAFFFTPGNPVLFGILLGSEIFHLAQVIGFVYTVWPRKIRRAFEQYFDAAVDIYITVCGEPVEIVRETVLAAKAMNYERKNIYILNDGFVAKKKNWREIEALARELGIGCITRRVGGGAKAGNINNAMRHTASEYVVIFDADHVPHADFLQKTMGYFADPLVGFVQTPQFYHNMHQNAVTNAAWSQQTLFFGPIMQGKNALNSAFMCGTNMVLSRTAIVAAGGMREDSIAEDFLTSLYVHALGYKSVYVPEVLAEGLAPEDFKSYYKQQFRWARGSLELTFKHNPFKFRGLSLSQKLQYSVSSGFYLGGLIVLLNALMPVVFLFTGLIALSTSSMLLAMVFLPYIFLNLYTLQITTSYSYSFQAISFSLSAAFMQLQALWLILTGRKSSFSVTSKKKIEGMFVGYVVPHLVYIGVAIVGLCVAIPRLGLSASMIANVAWILVNITVFTPFIYTATIGSSRKSIGQLLTTRIGGGRNRSRNAMTEGAE